MKICWINTYIFVYLKLLHLIFIFEGYVLCIWRNSACIVFCFLHFKDVPPLFSDLHCFQCEINEFVLNCCFSVVIVLCFTIVKSKHGFGCLYSDWDLTFQFCAILFSSEETKFNFFILIFFPLAFLFFSPLLLGLKLYISLILTLP